MGLSSFGGVEMLTILLVILIVLAIGALPRWGYVGHGAPSGLLFVIVIILLIYLLAGRGNVLP
jgi:hypothetical protein